jgi:hypothetical protein
VRRQGPDNGFPVLEKTRVMALSVLLRFRWSDLFFRVGGVIGS